MRWEKHQEQHAAKWSLICTYLQLQSEREREREKKREREREREKPKGTTVDSGMSLQLAACCVCTHVGLQHAAVEVPCATACRLMRSLGHAGKHGRLYTCMHTFRHPATVYIQASSHSTFRHPATVHSGIQPTCRGGIQPCRHIYVWPTT